LSYRTTVEFRIADLGAYVRERRFQSAIRNPQSEIESGGRRR